MTQQLQTDEGVGEDNTLIEWLQTNKLTHVKDKLQQHAVSLDELGELGNFLSIDKLREYAENTLIVDVMYANRFAKAVKKLSNKTTAPKVEITAPKIIRVVLSKEEDEAENNIERKKQQTNKLMNDILNDMNSLKNISKKNENEIIKFRNEFINKFNQRMDTLISISNTE
eukprot:446956_1